MRRRRLFSKKTSRVQRVTTNPMDLDFIVISPTRSRLYVNLHFDLVLPMFPMHIYLCDKPKIGSIDIGIVVFLLMTFLFWDYPMGLALGRNNPIEVAPSTRKTCGMDGKVSYVFKPSQPK